MIWFLYRVLFAIRQFRTYSMRRFTMFLNGNKLYLITEFVVSWRNDNQWARLKLVGKPIIECAIDDYSTYDVFASIHMHKFVTTIESFNQMCISILFLHLFCFPSSSIYQLVTYRTDSLVAVIFTTYLSITNAALASVPCIHSSSRRKNLLIIILYKTAHTHYRYQNR